jgi:hypothetical protein
MCGCCGPKIENRKDKKNYTFNNIAERNIYGSNISIVLFRSVFMGSDWGGSASPLIENFKKKNKICFYPI